MENHGTSPFTLVMTNITMENPPIFHGKITRELSQLNLHCGCCPMKNPPFIDEVPSRPPWSLDVEGFPVIVGSFSDVTLILYVCACHCWLLLVTADESKPNSRNYFLES
jgi:hypothetical protein